MVGIDSLSLSHLLLNILDELLLWYILNVNLVFILDLELDLALVTELAKLAECLLILTTVEETTHLLDSVLYIHGLFHLVDCKLPVHLLCSSILKLLIVLEVHNCWDVVVGLHLHSHHVLPLNLLIGHHELLVLSVFVLGLEHHLHVIVHIRESHLVCHHWVELIHILHGHIVHHWAWLLHLVVHLSTHWLLIHIWCGWSSELSFTMSISALITIFTETAFHEMSAQGSFVIWSL